MSEEDTKAFRRFLDALVAFLSAEKCGPSPHKEACAAKAKEAFEEYLRLNQK